MKTAIVTGGASGIGFATAARLARDVDAVALFDIHEERLENSKSAILAERPDRKIETYVCNVMDAEQVEQAVQKAAESFGRIDILVNVAGGSDYFDKDGSKLQVDLNTENLPNDYWNMVLQLNLTGTFYMTKAALPYMKAQQSGAIVNMASIAGRTGNILAGAAYSSAKAGIIGLTRHVAAEMAPHGIRCNAVAPGMVGTDRFLERQHSPKFQEMIRQIPFGRMSKPEEIADAIAFLALPTSSYVSGVVLDINGGWFIG